MPSSTNIDFLLPNMRQGPTAAMRVEANAQREKTSLFGEALDTINPLQHVPGVSQAYRAVTKDKISEGAKFAGHVGLGAAVAGPVGAAIGAGVYLVESLFGAIFGGGKKDSELVQAQNVKQGPTALTGDQAIHAGVMRPRGAGIPMQALAQAQARPLLPEARAADPAPASAKPVTSAAAPSLGSAPVDMSSDQFAALMAAFGSSAPTSTAKRENDDRQPQGAAQGATAVGGADFAARMAANLDKLDALKRNQAGQ